MGRTRASKSKDEKIIAALISSKTVKEASELCGISERQIYKRLNDEEFKIEYNSARTRIVTQAVGNIQGLLGEAIERLRSVMNDSDSSPQTQINAADAILRHCLKLTETADVMQRLDKLEETEAERDGNMQNAD